MIIATDTETGKIYEIGIPEPVQGGYVYLNGIHPGFVWRPSGNDHSYRRTRLTPLPTSSDSIEPAHVEVLYRRLGKTVYEMCPEQHRDRIGGWGPHR